MKLSENIPSDLGPGVEGVRFKRQPYYIAAAAYDSLDADARMRHELCSLLNQFGFEAYVDAPSTNGDLWTPQLTANIKAAHYKAKKKPIVVYPKASKRARMKLGLAVGYSGSYFVDAQEGGVGATELALAYAFGASQGPASRHLCLPTLSLEMFAPPDEVRPRNDILLYKGGYSGPVKDHGLAVVELSVQKPDSLEAREALYGKAKVLYAYEWSSVCDEARLCGCAVVLVPNAEKLPRYFDSFKYAAAAGLAWGLTPEALDQALLTVNEFRQNYQNLLSSWRAQLRGFIDETQALACEMPIEMAWPQATVDELKGIYSDGKELAARADRAKWRRLHEQYKQWRERSSLREIDGQIYAEHTASGKLPQLSVFIDQRGASVDALADTLDSLMACLGHPAEVAIVSDQAAPDALVGSNAVRWIQTQDEKWATPDASPLRGDWALLVQAGTTLLPQALMEWSLATFDWSQAKLIYADEDVQQSDGSASHPYFKPDPNIELLRCTNYLGGAVLVRTNAWQASGCPLFDGALYAWALGLLNEKGRLALGHVDTVLSHSGVPMTSRLEGLEFKAASQALVDSGRVRAVRPLDLWGTWLPEYPAPENGRVSLVVPTGVQTGYLRSLIESLQLFPQPALEELIFVCAPEHLDEVRFAVSGLTILPYQIIEQAQSEYNHAAALNAGVAHASGDYVLIADDDTEVLHGNWLSLLLGVAMQSDVGCVAPRLMASRGKDPKVVGGPQILGINGCVGSYMGEEQRHDEIGVYSRLQLTQDVSAVAGHFFLVRKSDWTGVGGFDAAGFGLHFPVLDFCLRLSRTGKRHVWTPLASVLHQGGKTVESLKRDTKLKIRFAEREIQEVERLLSVWPAELARDPNYNRHLSLNTPFDIDADVVIDWNPKRHDRPRALALPVHSGAGQYRVIEPMNAVQDAGLAQTCVVLPMENRHFRVLQPLELLRAAPDCLVLQHSVDDGQLRQIEHYKLAAPHVRIVQMVDDLFGEVPGKHPGRHFQSREGHQRMMQALIRSDRLVVTTEPLREHYRKYVPDVRLVPNALDKQWLGLRKVQPARERLRVGWVGAAQHQGDLEMITEVVRTLAKDVDWVFMGMCTDEIRPYLKEFHPFVSISEYPQKMSTLDLDIAIAPLEDNLFNRCKSNLRLLEYGAMGWPVVCSDVFPYQTDDAPVVRCDNVAKQWIVELERLIKDREHRLSMAEKLHQWVMSRYLLEQHVTQWKESLFD